MNTTFKVTRLHCPKDGISSSLLAYAFDLIRSDKWTTSKDLYESILSKSREMMNKYKNESSMIYIILKVLKMIREECSRVIRGDPELEAFTTNLLFAQVEIEIENVPKDDLRDFLIEALDIFSSDMSESESLAMENALLYIGEEDVIMLYGFSDLVLSTLSLAIKKKKFSVVVLVNGTNNGALMVEKLANMGIHVVMAPERAACTLMTRVHKVFLGCERVFSDGAILSQAGTTDVCISAEYNNLPVYVCTPISNLSPFHSLDHRLVLAENPDTDDWVTYVNDVVPAKYLSMIFSNLGSMEPYQMIAMARDSFCPEDVEALFSAAI